MTPWKISPIPIAATKKPANARRCVDAARADPAHDPVGIGEEQISPGHRRQDGEGDPRPRTASEPMDAARARSSQVPWRSLRGRTLAASPAGRDIGVGAMRGVSDRGGGGGPEQRKADPHQNDVADDPHHADRHVKDLQQQGAENQKKERQQSGVGAGPPLCPAAERCFGGDSAGPAQQARVWFYRVVELYATNQTTPYASINGAIAGIAGPGGAFYRDVPPGHDQIVIGGGGMSPSPSRDVALVAGEQVYVKIGLGARWNCQGFKIALEPSDVGPRCDRAQKILSPALRANPADA